MLCPLVVRRIAARVRLTKQRIPQPKWLLLERPQRQNTDLASGRIAQGSITQLIANLATRLNVEIDNRRIRFPYGLNRNRLCVYLPHLHNPRHSRI